MYLCRVPRGRRVTNGAVSPTRHPGPYEVATMTAKTTTATARKTSNTGKGKGKGKPAAGNPDKVGATPAVTTTPVAVPVVPVVKTPAAVTAPRTGRAWPANPAAPMPAAAGKLLQVLHAAGAVDAQHGRTKGQCIADGATNYGPTECRAAGLIEWDRGAGGTGTAGTRYLYLTAAGVAWATANPTPVVLPPRQGPAVVLPPVQGPVTADGAAPMALPAAAG